MFDPPHEDGPHGPLSPQNVTRHPGEDRVPTDRIPDIVLLALSPIPDDVRPRREELPPARQAQVLGHPLHALELLEDSPIGHPEAPIVLGHVAHQLLGLDGLGRLERTVLPGERVAVRQPFGLEPPGQSRHALIEPSGHLEVVEDTKPPRRLDPVHGEMGVDPPELTDEEAGRGHYAVGRNPFSGSEFD